MRIHTQLKKVFVTVLIALSALTTLVQVTGAEQPSGKASLFASLLNPKAFSQTLRPSVTTAGNGGRIPMTGSQIKRQTAGSTNPSNLSFLPVVTYFTGGDAAMSVAVADLNGDDKPDLVVANETFSATGGSVAVLLGNGDGTFQPAINYDSGGTSALSVAVADLNGDGRPDILVANCGPVGTGCSTRSVADGVVGVLLGNGDGTFQPAVTYDSGGTEANSMAVADLNNDGKLDVVVANECSNNSGGLCTSHGSVGVLLGNGDGTFQPAVSYDQGGNDSGSVVVADVNGDGRPDLLIARRSVNVLLGNGDGTFQPAVSYGSGGAASAAVADVNGDGKPDLLLALSNGAVQVMLGTGDGTFQPAVTYDSGGDQADSVVVADVNGDGKPDILAVNQCVPDLNCPHGAVSVLLGNGDGTFQAAVIYDSGGFFPNSIVVTDVNGDGRPDLLVSNFAVDSFSQQFGAVSVRLNNTASPSTRTTLVSSMNPAAVQQNVTYTARVTGQSGAVTGTIMFQDGGSVVGKVTVAGNKASYTTSYKVHGLHALTATYSGDVHNAASTSASLREYIGNFPALSQTVVTTSGSPSFVGQPVTFTASATPRDSSFGTIPDGELVTFYDGTVRLGSVALSGGTAVYTAPSLFGEGQHYIKAIYPGDALFKPSNGFVDQVVKRYPTASLITSSLNPSIYGQKVTWTATVASSLGITLTGKVSFKGNGNSFGPIMLNANGVATLTKELNADTYSLNAVYSGDAMNQGSTSAVLNQAVLETTSSATLTSSPNPSTRGQAVSFTAKILSPTVIARGPVTFSEGKIVLGTAQLSGGKAMLTISSLPAGSTKVTVTYYGDSNIAKSSASVVQTVH
jgi:Bacterial Ig-like domain (group 3)/FG-GAP-like repeat